MKCKHFLFFVLLCYGSPLCNAQTAEDVPVDKSLIQEKIKN